MTDEIIKLYENAGVKADRIVCYRGFDNCIYNDFNCHCHNEKPCKDADKIYQQFTAEKQIEIIEVISTNHISDDYEYKYLGIDRDEIDKEIYLNLCIDGKKYHAHDKDFGIALAKLVNLIWQDLTEQERIKIKSILE